jgi:hypothetical protein
MIAVTFFMTDLVEQRELRATFWKAWGATGAVGGAGHRIGLSGLRPVGRLPSGHLSCLGYLS